MKDATTTQQHGDSVCLDRNGIVVILVVPSSSVFKYKRLCGFYGHFSYVQFGVLVLMTTRWAHRTNVCISQQFHSTVHTTKYTHQTQTVKKERETERNSEKNHRKKYWYYYLPTYGHSFQTQVEKKKLLLSICMLYPLFRRSYAQFRCSLDHIARPK